MTWRRFERTAKAKVDYQCILRDGSSNLFTKGRAGTKPSTSVHVWDDEAKAEEHAATTIAKWLKLTYVELPPDAPDPFATAAVLALPDPSGLMPDGAVDLRAMKIRGKVVPVSREILDTFEQNVGGLPNGYRSFLEHYGPGTYCKILYLTHPAAIVESSKQIHADGLFAAAPTFWPNIVELLSLDDIAKLVVIGTSMDGDNLVFLPGESRLFVLPRHRDVVDSIASFGHALAWFSHSERYWQPAKTITYEPIEPRTVVTVSLPALPQEPATKPWKELVALLPRPRKASGQSCVRTYVECTERRWVFDYAPGVKEDNARLTVIFPTTDDTTIRETVVLLMKHFGWTASKIERNTPPADRHSNPGVVPHWADLVASDI